MQTEAVNYFGIILRLGFLIWYFYWEVRNGPYLDVSDCKVYTDSAIKVKLRAGLECSTVGEKHEGGDVPWLNIKIKKSLLIVRNIGNNYLKKSQMGFHIGFTFGPKDLNGN